VITGGDLWNQVALWLYSIDAADNLFPSIHCLVSWFCYLGIRGRKEIPHWYQRVSMVIAILVFASTLLTKQHVIVDVAGGILLAEFCFFIGKKTDLYRIYERFGSRIEQKIRRLTEG
jgi:membrane-associated phospholipid phosphatase